MTTIEPEMSGPCSDVSTLPVSPIRDLCASRPLLVLFYPDFSLIASNDLEQTYAVFRKTGISPEQPLAELDVLLHTVGGFVDPAYQLALLLRLLAQKVRFLVPERALSAGTLLCLSADGIEMGHTAALGPLDITVGIPPEVGETEQSVSLAAIDGLIEFAGTAQSRAGRDSEQLASQVIVKLIDELGAVQVGDLYRQRRLTEHYARELMTRYMFGQPGLSPRQVRQRVKHIARVLVHELPTHEFVVDVTMAKQLGLPASGMSTALHDVCGDLVTALEAQVDDLCPFVSDDNRAPFVALYT